MSWIKRVAEQRDGYIAAGWDEEQATQMAYHDIHQLREDRERGVDGQMRELR